MYYTRFQHMIMQRRVFQNILVQPSHKDTGLYKTLNPGFPSRKHCSV